MSTSRWNNIVPLMGDAVAGDGDALLKDALQCVEKIIESIDVEDLTLGARVLGRPSSLTRLQEVLATLRFGGASIALPAHEEDAPEAQIAASNALSASAKLYVSVRACWINLKACAASCRRTLEQTCRGSGHSPLH